MRYHSRQILQYESIAPFFCNIRSRHQEPHLFQQPKLQACTGGRRSIQGRACSSCEVTRINRSSRPIAATSRTPTDSPSGVQWSGNEIAGWPVILKGRVKKTCRAILRPSLCGLSSTGVIEASVADRSQTVGVSNRSNPVVHHRATRLTHSFVHSSARRCGRLPQQCAGASILRSESR